MVRQECYYDTFHILELQGPSFTRTTYTILFYSAETLNKLFDCTLTHGSLYRKYSSYNFSTPNRYLMTANNY